MLLRTADEHRDHQPLVPPDRGAEWAPRSFWQAPVGVDFAAPVAAGADVEAFVNEGRWIAECPDCCGAQLTTPTDRRFMCHCCGNVGVGGRWRRVVWPSRTVDIEGALSARPHPVNRNWSPGESVGQLRRENDERGV